MQFFGMLVRRGEVKQGQFRGATGIDICIQRF